MITMAKPKSAVRRVPLTVLTPLAALCAGVSFAGCSSPPDQGILDGTLQAVGGPAGTGPRPLSGSVTFHGSNGNIATIDLSANGRFSAQPAHRSLHRRRRESPVQRGCRRVSGTRTSQSDQRRHEPRRDRLPGEREPFLRASRGTAISRCFRTIPPRELFRGVVGGHSYLRCNRCHLGRSAGR